MKSCGFGSPGLENQTAPTQPWGHAVENGKVVSLKPGIQSDNPPALGPAGTVHCSANDWRKFLALFLNEAPQEILSTQTLEKLKSKVDEQGPYTFSSIGRMEREWAKGSVYAMAGSNTYNYAIVAVAPALNRIYTINTNIGDEKAEAGVTQILKELTQLK